VIGLRADNHIDHRRAAKDLAALGLGDATGDSHHQIAAFGVALLLQLGQPSELRIDLLGGLFANVAGVDQHQIGRLDRIDALIAIARQRVAHALAVIDIHLAAIGLDEDLFRLAAGLSGSFNDGRGGQFGVWCEECLCHAGAFSRKTLA